MNAIAERHLHRAPALAHEPDASARLDYSRPFGRNERTRDVIVLLLPGFSQLSLASTLEPLRCANEVAGSELFRWRLVGASGREVMSSSGIPIRTSMDFAGERERLFGSSSPWSVFICAGADVERFVTPELQGLLRAYSRQRIALVGLGTGTWVLAACGLLAHTRCTIHWKRIAALGETYRNLEISDALYVTDGQITSCAGELAAFDLVSSMMQSICGDEITQDICRLLMADRWRDGESRQAAPVGLRLGSSSASLVEAIRLMECNLEAPLPMAAISLRVGLSRRQLERLFERHVSSTPWRYYVSLRLDKARQLVVQTGLPMVTIAVSCGFVTASHFSKCFRDRYGISPNSMRTRRDR